MAATSQATQVLRAPPTAALAGESDQQWRVKPPHPEMCASASCWVIRLNSVLGLHTANPEEAGEQQGEGPPCGLQTPLGTSDLHLGVPTPVWPVVEIDSEFVAVHTFLYLVLPVMDQGSGADD